MFPAVFVNSSPRSKIPFSSTFKRKKRKAWKKRKQKEGGENKETTLIADVHQIPDAEPPAKTKREEQTLVPGHKAGYL